MVAYKNTSLAEIIDEDLFTPNLQLTVFVRQLSLHGWSGISSGGLISCCVRVC